MSDPISLIMGLFSLIIFVIIAYIGYRIYKLFPECGLDPFCYWRNRKFIIGRTETIVK